MSFRINKDTQLVAGRRTVDDDNPQVDIDLCCGKTNSRRRIHGFTHVVD